MSEIDSKDSDGWKDKIEAVAAKDLRGVFAILYLPDKGTLVVIPDSDMVVEKKGIEVLLGAYIPPGLHVAFWPSEPNAEQYPAMEKGELIYTYSRQAYQGRLEVLGAAAKSAKKSFLIRPTDPTSSIWGKMILALLIQGGVLFMVVKIAGGMPGGEMLSNPRLMATWIGLALVVAVPINLVIIKSGGAFAALFMRIMGHSNEPAQEGYSRELALAGRGEREEAIRLLEDRFSGSQDPQALREALRVAMKVPPMPEDGRRLIQELLKLKTVAAHEKARLKEDLAALG